MRRHCLSLALLGIFISVPAWSAGDGDLWILPAAVACVAQYPELSSTDLGSKLMKAPQAAQQVDAAKAAFATRPWPGRALCDELMHLDPHAQHVDQAYFDKLREKHLDALSALQERLPAFWGATESPR